MSTVTTQDENKTLNYYLGKKGESVRALMAISNKFYTSNRLAYIHILICVILVFEIRCALKI